MGPEKGKKVTNSSLQVDYALIQSVEIVLVPGLSIPAIIWRNVAPRLAARGFRVLLYGAVIFGWHRQMY